MITHLKAFTRASKCLWISFSIKVDERNSRTFWASFRLNESLPKKSEMESLCLCFNSGDTVCESKHMFLRVLKRAPFVSAISVFFIP